MTENKTLVSNISKKWKLEQIPSKKLEMENKLMEERLQFLKSELLNDKNKRSIQGGNLWSKGQPGPVTTYAKTVLKNDKTNNEESVLNKLTNRQIKLKVLKDEAVTKVEKINTPKEKKMKCGQCEKGLAFTRCLECGEDYCANCFTSFHMKGALQKHRTVPISNEANLNKLYSQSHLYQIPNDTSMLSSRSTVYSETNEIINRNPMKAVSFSENTQSKKSDPGSLLHGEYDEREAQESFKQAVSEWRNNTSATTRNNNNTKVNSNFNKTESNTIQKDAIIETEGQIPRTFNDTKKNLEAVITSNHSLSYAERILLQKYRSNELDYLRETSNLDDKTNKDINLRNTAKLANSQHIDFDNLMSSLQDETQTQTELLTPKNSFNDKNFEHILTNRENSFSIEEMGTYPIKKSINYSSGEPRKTSNEKSLKSSVAISKKSVTKSETVNISSASTIKDETKESSERIGSGLTRTPSKFLKEITARTAELPSKLMADINGVGDFLMLDVVNSKKTPTSASTEIASPRKTGIQRENSKLSNNLYNMSPRSWNPNKSVSVHGPSPLTTNKDVPTISKELSKTNIKNASGSENMQARKNEKIPSAKLELAKNTNVVKTNSSLDFKKKVFENGGFNTKKANPHDELKQRHKSFVGPLSKTSPTKNDKVRPVSASCSFPNKSNKQNLDFSHQFIEFDIDDGRSSKLCQNEEDESYFGELEVEFKSSVHRVSNNNKENGKKAAQSFNSDLVESTEKLTKNVKNFNLEQSLKNDENYDEMNDDLEMMMMEELKML